MAAFTYVARDAQGNVIRASVEAPSQMTALARLRDHGYAVVDISAADRKLNGERSIRRSRDARRGPRSRRRVPLTELALFSRQLSIAVGSGMPLREALESIVVDLDHAGLSAALRQVILDLHNGLSFAAALSRGERAFGTLFVALAKAAEESGSLPRTLQQLAAYLERSEQLEQKIRRSTTYPVFIIVFFFIVCVVMTTFVLPQFQEIFEGFDASLPLFSTLVFEMNRALLAVVPYVALGLAGTGVGLALWRRTDRGKLWVDCLKLKAPFVGRWLHKFAMARFCRNLAIMLRGGVPITRAIDISSSISGNRMLERSLGCVRDRLVAGQPFSESLGEDPEIPRLVVRMVAMGEDSGHLPEVLEKVSDVYENQVESSITVAMSLLEPVVICVFGTVIMGLILAIYMPIFTIGANVH